MSPEQTIQSAFGVVLVITVFCLVQQIRMGKKKKQHYDDLPAWHSCHNWQLFYHMVGIPFAVATGVLLAKAQSIWLGA